MAKPLKIVLHPDPTLREISQELSPLELASPIWQERLLDMEETMKKKDGAGLAAPQIGESKRVIVIADNQKTIFMVNPRLTKRSWAKEIEEEGCLSVLNNQGEIIYGLVERHKRVSCVYLDAKGQKKKLSAEGLLARVIQHEIDHLDGVLFIDKLVSNPKKKNSNPASFVGLDKF